MNKYSVCNHWLWKKKGQCHILFNYISRTYLKEKLIASTFQKHWLDYLFLDRSHLGEVKTNVTFQVTVQHFACSLMGDLWKARPQEISSQDGFLLLLCFSCHNDFWALVHQIGQIIWRPVKIYFLVVMLWMNTNWWFHNC